MIETELVLASIHQMEVTMYKAIILLVNQQNFIKSCINSTAKEWYVDNTCWQPLEAKIKCVEDCIMVYIKMKAERQTTRYIIECPREIINKDISIFTDIGFILWDKNICYQVYPISNWDRKLAIMVH